MLSKTKYKIFILIILVIITSCGNKKKVFQRTFFKLDTVVTITIISDIWTDNQFESLIASIKTKLDYYDNIFNIHNRKSEVAKITKFISDKPYKISSDLYKVLNICKKYYKATDENFDPTVGSITLLYNFTNGNRPPDNKKIKQALQKIGLDNITLLNDNLIKIKRSPVYLDLGGIAKGYIIDRVSEIIHKKGIKNFLVNIGGDIYAAGKNYQGTKWRIGIQNPRKSLRL